MRRNALSTTSKTKQEIQAVLREIVILRDGGCVLRGVRHCQDSVIQCDHLITRANSATYADSRLCVALCRACHGGFKQWHKNEYDALIRQILPKERVLLWQRAEEDSWRPTRKYTADWKLALVALIQERDQLKEERQGVFIGEL